MADASQVSSFDFRTVTSYDVFLSFRGIDTRGNFTDRLYGALKQAGVHTFRDDNGIERGENIKSELQKAIQYSRISIVVFSRNYANSGWCLDELALILKRYKTSGHVIFPVFYHVEKSLFTTQSGSVAEAFSRHEERVMRNQSNEKRNEGFERIKGWKSALQEVAEMGGMMLNNQADYGQEVEFIEKVVKVVEDKLCRSAMDVVPELVAMKARTEDIRLWLEDDRAHIFTYVLSGMGGIGKTTIAKFMYNLYANSFVGSSFLANIRERSVARDSVVGLQKQLLSDILKEKYIEISSIDEGIRKIKDALRCVRVLLVFDDVDQPHQITEVLGMQEGLCVGSKIIITTQNDWWLSQPQFCKIEKVGVFSRDESMKLFSWHAFGREIPFEGYLHLAKRVIELCEGLPLAIRVLGSSLVGKRPDVWESVVQKLKVIPNNQILKKIKLSYDSLQDEHDRNLFLHISCFFCGMDIYTVTNVLNDCGYFTEVGIQNLIQRSLLEIDERNKLSMHHVLRDMGRGIIRQESPQDPGKRSRIWRLKDSLDILREKTGTEALQGIICNMHDSSDDQRVDRGTSMQNYTEQDYLKEYLENSSQESVPGNSCWNSMPRASYQAKYLETDSFTKMKNLELLKLVNVNLTGNFNEFPKRLRWLSWHHFCLSEIPNDFPLQSLVVIDLRYNHLKHLWKGAKFLGSVKVLNLSHSWELRRMPNLSGLPKLEKLILKKCLRLVKVHTSISKLEGLILLNLKDCRSLKSLPREISQLGSLRTLDITGCSNLRHLPMEIRMLNSLKELHADGVTFSKMDLVTEVVRSCNIFSQLSNPRPEFSWLFLPSTLVSLSLVDCNLSNNNLTTDLRELSVLEKLDLSGNPIHSLPESLRSLPNLSSFSVSNCTSLKSLIGLPRIKELFIDGCTSLEIVTYQSTLSNLPTIPQSDDNHSLMTLQGVFKLESLDNVDPQLLTYFGLDIKSVTDTEIKVDHQTSYVERELPIQGLYERGVFTLFIPGYKIPDLFVKTICTSAIIEVAPQETRVQGLSFAIFYTAEERETTERGLWTSNRLVVHNRTKDLKWIHKPTIFGIPQDSRGMTWLSHWKFGRSMDAGDEVFVSVSLQYLFTVKEFGWCLNVDDENEYSHDVGDEASSKAKKFNHGFFYHDFVPGDVSKPGKVYKLPMWAGNSF